MNSGVASGVFWYGVSVGVGIGFLLFVSLLMVGALIERGRVKRGRSGG